MLQEHVKNIITSKLNILIFSVSMIPHLAGWKEFFIKYGENMDVIFLSIFVMVLLFSFYVYRSIKANKKISNAQKEIDIIIDTSKKNSNKLFIKTFTSLLILIIVVSLSFLYFLKNATVYYIRVSENLSMNEVVSQRNKIRAIFVLSGNEQYFPTIRRRSARNQSKNYFLSINGAFLDKKKAELQFRNIKNLLKGNNSITIIPNTTAHFTRKIEYLVAHFIPYKILRLTTDNSVNHLLHPN